MSVNPWLKPNRIDDPPVKIVITERFKDEKGNPIPWTFQKLSAKETDELQEACMKQSYNPVTKSQTMQIEGLKYINALAARTIIDPNLKDKELQESYGTLGSEVDTMNAMLYPEEKDKLAEEINNLYRLDEDVLREKADDAKNE